MLLMIYFSTYFYDPLTLLNLINLLFFHANITINFRFVNHQRGFIHFKLMMQLHLQPASRAHLIMSVKPTNRSLASILWYTVNYATNDLHIQSAMVCCVCISACGVSLFCVYWSTQIHPIYTLQPIHPTAQLTRCGSLWPMGFACNHRI